MTDLTLADAARMMCAADAGHFLNRIQLDDNGCWIWTGCRSKEGYGRAKWRGKVRQLHRVTYEILVGPFADELTIDHLCGQPSCVNPQHLEPVPLRTNILRGDGVGVRNARKTHCARGHEFTPENTYTYAGKRRCRECGRAATRRWRAR